MSAPPSRTAPTGTDRGPAGGAARPCAPASRSRPAGVVTAVLATLLVGILLALAGPAGPASAHAELSRSDPADGARLAQAPTRITLEFGEDLLPETVRIVASAADGAQVSLPDPEVAANVAAVGWPDGQPAGAYTVSYRVVSQDGHPVTGSLSFSYEGARSGTATATADPQTTGGAGTPVATGGAATSGTPAPTPVTGTPGTSGTPAASGGTGTGSPAPLLASILVLTAVGIGVWIVVRSRRSGP